MLTYKAIFQGRTKNALGITYKIETTVKGDNEEDARIRLYDRFEHIRGEVSFTEIAPSKPEGEVTP